MVKYQWRKRGDDNWSDPVSLRRAVQATVKRVKTRKPPYRVYEKSHPKTLIQRWDIAEARAKFREALKAEKAKDNHVWRLESKNGFFVAVRKIRIPNPITLAPPPAIGTPSIKQWHREAFGKFSGLRSWGVYSCRPPSQHSRSNAEDVNAAASTMEALFQFSIGHPMISEAIYNRRIWTRARASEGIRRYTGANPHTDHVHVSGNPLLNSGFCQVAR